MLDKGEGDNSTEKTMFGRRKDDNKRKFNEHINPSNPNKRKDEPKSQRTDGHK